PGDPRVVQGTLVWLPGTSGEPFAVVRADDGKHVVVDLSGAQSRGTIGVGDRVSVVGVEGMRPFEIATIVIGAGDAALTAVPPAPACASAGSWPWDSCTPSPPSARRSRALADRSPSPRPRHAQLLNPPDPITLGPTATGGSPMAQVTRRTFLAGSIAATALAGA